MKKNYLCLELTLRANRQADRRARRQRSAVSIKKGEVSYPSSVFFIDNFLVHVFGFVFVFDRLEGACATHLRRSRGAQRLETEWALDLEKMRTFQPQVREIFKR